MIISQRVMYMCFFIPVSSEYFPGGLLHEKVEDARHLH